MPPSRRRRDAIPNRQYDEFQSTTYATVSLGELCIVGVSSVWFVCANVFPGFIHQVNSSEESDRIH